MKRLYYLLSDIDKLERISDQLHAEGISDWRFHVLARNDDGLIRHHLHSANFFMKRDVVHSGERGALIGAGVGLYLCAFIAPYAVASTTVLAMVLLLTTFACAWVGSLVGGFHENYKISRFHDALERGLYLVLVDVKKEEEARVRALVHRLCPDLKIAGVDSIFTNPFKSGKSYRLSIR